MAKKKYKAKEKSFMIKSNKEAQIVGEHLESIMARMDGALKTEDVLEDARKKKSPLHKYFTWDDKKASHLYRMREARMLIGEVVEVVVVGRKKETHRSFYNVRKGNGVGTVYVTLQEAITTQDYMEQLIQDAQENITNLNKTLSLFLVHYKKSKKK